MAELPFCSHHSEGETIRDMLVCQIKIPNPPKIWYLPTSYTFFFFNFTYQNICLNSITNKNNNKNKNKIKIKKFIQ
jgi:hypothetical protein